ncbi:alpha/beta fold hydrolase [Actinomadura decatromicini]|uniref:Alpha/beta hydrolase n=1 Tax=Actinomadura decatromicini TaxID=2604572 RepID=A0A5D3F7Q0_9ACTN|nr:alpha/beta hydrolase [Actinomadura decatromicini]TYK43934.1 alpha/beta hydrolase [Actinomadura decatromicini]
MTPTIPGFDGRTVRAGGLDLHVAAAGEGPPLLLLHGFPQTHLAWRRVAPALADRFHVVCPDLPGYGASDGPDGGHEHYAKRTTAATMVSLMRRLGHERFSVVGHDRGALVAFRAALDHPAVVERLGVIDVIPATDMWASLRGVGGVFAFHLYFLAQPGDLPERVIGADSDTFFGHFLDAWVDGPDVIRADVREAYLAAARRPAAIHAICQDYRAGAFVDAVHDDEDRRAGRLIRAPTLAIWQDPGDVVLPFDPAAVWREWAPDLSTLTLPGGHFLPEAQPEAVTAAIEELLGRPG